MTHTIKIPLLSADLFIYKVTDNVIEYELRDKSTGVKTSARKESSYEVVAGKATWDGGYTLPLSLLETCRQMLESA